MKVLKVEKSQKLKVVLKIEIWGRKSENGGDELEDVFAMDIVLFNVLHGE